MPPKKEANTSMMAKLQELRALNPERAEEFVRSTPYLAPSERIQVSKEMGIGVSSSTLSARDLQSKQDEARIQVSRGSAAHTVAGILGGGVPERRPLDASMPQQRMLDKALSPEKSQAYNQAFDSYSSSYRSKLDLMQHVHKPHRKPSAGDDWKLELLLPDNLRESSKFCFSGGSRQSRRHLVDLQSENGTLNVLGARGDPRRR